MLYRTYENNIYQHLEQVYKKLEAIQEDLEVLLATYKGAGQSFKVALKTLKNLITHSSETEKLSNQVRVIVDYLKSKQQ